ncbi:hypothetical [Yersinia pestis KIM10+]|uniref:Uncharacterized protein n=1 Tax=Yersinia pestis TaxID=632 RepID=Q8CLR4_YERPE|nr:hypothetical [Yersinia pestis KIM10+]
MESLRAVSYCFLAGNILPNILVHHLHHSLRASNTQGGWWVSGVRYHD